MKNRTGFILLWFLIAQITIGQELRTMTRLSQTVNETSGIEISGENGIWTFNDSGGDEAIYLCDTSGNIIKTVKIKGAWNRDWEDIAQDDEGNFYIGNIGNNNNDTRDLSIFKIPNPNDISDGGSVQAQVIKYSYEDQYAYPPSADKKNFDCEALFWANGNLYLVSKNRTEPFDGKCYLYRLPDDAGDYTAKNIGEFDTDGTSTFTNWITAADISPDGKKLCLLSSNKLWLFYDFTSDNFFEGKNKKIYFPTSTQKEAVAFVNNDLLYITDEDWGNEGLNLYSMYLEQEKGPYLGVPHNVPGRIEAENYDYGGENSSYLDNTSGNEGGSYRTDDVDVESTEDVDGDYNIGWIDDNEWLEYSVYVESTSMYDVLIRAAGEKSGVAHIEVDNNVIGESFIIPSTSGWQEWSSFKSNSIQMNAGNHTFKIVFEKGGVNVNYFEFKKQVVTNITRLSENDLFGYPNPTNSMFMLNSYADWQVLSLIGDEKMRGKGRVIDMSTLPSYYYLVVVNGQRFTVLKL